MTRSVHPHLIVAYAARTGPRKIRLIGDLKAATSQAHQLRSAGFEGSIAHAEPEPHDPRAVPPTWWPDGDDAA